MIRKATVTEEGLEERACKNDTEHKESRAIPKLISIKNAKVVLSATSFVYNGKVSKPAVKTIGGKKLIAGKDYTIKLSAVSPKNVGSYKVTPRKPVTLRKARLARRNIRLIRKKILKVTGKKGKVTYAIRRVSKKKFRKYFRIKKKNGALTVKKGLKKGTYRVYIKVRASGNISYKPATRNVSVKIRVK